MTRWGRQAEVTAPTSPSAAMLGHASVATMLRLSAPVTQVGAGALVDAIDPRQDLRIRGIAASLRVRNPESRYPTRDFWCRERESNSPKARPGEADAA